MKLMKHIIIAILFISPFLYSIETINKMSATAAIRNDLDELINKLTFEKNHQINMTISEQKEFLDKESKNDLKDKVLNAFESLSHDFDIYEDVAYKPYEIVNKTKSDIKKELNNYTSKIDRTFEDLDKINSYHHKIIQNKEKLALISRLKTYLTNLNYLVTVSRKSNLRRDILSHLKNISFLYSEYITTHKQIDKKILRQYEEINTRIKESQENGLKIRASLNLLEKMLNLTKEFEESNKISHNETLLDTEKALGTFSRYIKEIVDIDYISETLRNKFQIRIAEISNSTTTGNREKLQALVQISKKLNTLANLNKRIVIMKKQVLTYLKQYSFKNLNQILELTKTKSNDLMSNYKKMHSLKNCLENIHNIFATTDNIHQIKDKIKDNITKLNGMVDIRKYQKLHEKLSNTIKSISNGTKVNWDQTKRLIEMKRKRPIFQEINSRVLKNSSEISIKLVSTSNKLHDLHNQIVEEYSKMTGYSKEISKTNQLINQDDNYSHVKEQIEKSHQIIEYLYSLIKITRSAITSLNNNNHMIDFSHKKLNTIIKKLEGLKTNFNGFSNNREQLPKEEACEIAGKIKKLTELYKYLKEGTIHDYIRNQVLKKIINFNSSLMSKIDLSKTLSILRLKEELLKKL